MGTPLDPQTIRQFTRLLNKGGYVLDFSDHEFALFTKRIVGVSIQERYGLSKGKSLKQYLYEADREDSIKLLNALMDEWEVREREEAPALMQSIADKCWRILKELKELGPVNATFRTRYEYLDSRGFTSEYLSKQREVLMRNIQDDPTMAIGLAKELVESCCHSILEARAVVQPEPSTTLPKLVTLTQKTLQIAPKEVNATIPQADEVKRLLGSLTNTVKSLAELRNSYGSGHGKSMSYVALSPRHARLAAGAALSVVEYLWDTHLHLQSLSEDGPGTV